MSRLEWNLPNEEAPISTSGTEEQRNLKASMLYHVLPAMVRNRMPALPSLRRSVSEFHTRSLHSKNNSITEISVPETPPPGYTSRPGSGSTTPHHPPTEPSMFDFEDDVSVASSVPSTPAPPIISYETSTGINWQHARHGVVIMTQAHQQSSTPARENDDIMTAIIRSQYVHGITLLLRSLPNTLTPAEKLNLFAAVPQSVFEMQTNQRTHALTPATHANTTMQDASRDTLLWRITAWLVFRLFLMIQFMLPIIREFLGHAAQFEHEHQITRRLFSTSLTLGSAVSRNLGQIVCQVNDGAVGEALSKATVYCAEGIGGGIQQGIAEALRSQELRGQKGRIEAATK